MAHNECIDLIGSCKNTPFSSPLGPPKTSEADSSFDDEEEPYIDPDEDSLIRILLQLRKLIKIP